MRISLAIVLLLGLTSAIRITGDDAKVKAEAAAAAKEAEGKEGADKEPPKTPAE